MKNKENLVGKCFCLTDTGKLRHKNEDAALALQNKDGVSFLVVCDGMGGHDNGDIASGLAVSSLQASFEKKKSFGSVLLAKNWLLRAIKKANKAIYSHVADNSSPTRMGTTLVVALIYRGHLLYANMGDSRAYVIAHDTLTQISEDETYADYLYRTGKIKKEERDQRVDRHVLTNALGIYPVVNVEVKAMKLEAHQVILCSDGLYNHLSKEELMAVMKRKISLKEKCIRLIQKCNINGGSDNISVSIWEEDV